MSITIIALSTRVVYNLKAIKKKEKAATKIQAAFRENLVRKSAATKIQAAFREKLVRKAAATKIQAIHRGNQGRKEAAETKIQKDEFNKYKPEITKIHNPKFGSYGSLYLAGYPPTPVSSPEPGNDEQT